MRARSRPSVPLLLLQNHTHLRYGRLHKEKRGKNRFWCTRGESEDGKKNKEKQTGSERALSLLFFLSLSRGDSVSLTGKRFSHCHKSSLPAWTRLTSTPERGASQETTGLTRLSWQSLASFLFPCFSPLFLYKNARPGRGSCLQTTANLITMNRDRPHSRRKEVLRERPARFWKISSCRERRGVLVKRSCFFFFFFFTRKLYPTFSLLLSLSSLSLSCRSQQQQQRGRHCNSAAR